MEKLRLFPMKLAIVIHRLLLLTLEMKKFVIYIYSFIL